MTGSMIVFESIGKAVLKRFEVPEVGAGEVLVETDFSVVSAGTERDNLLNRPNTSGGFPYHPGYSSCGRVMAVGEGVEGVGVGDRVVQNFLGHRSHTVAQAGRLTVIRDARVASLDAAFVSIGAMGLQGARKLQVQLGESAMVFGLGILGTFALQGLVLDGAIPVIVCDFDARRRELALRLGADHAFAPDEPDLPGKVRELTGGRGVDGAVEATGVAAALQQALACVAREGRITLLGCIRVSDAPVDFYQQVHKPGVSIIGAHTFVRPQVDSRPGYWTLADDFRTLLAFLAVGRLQVRPLISEIVSPAEAPSVYGRLATEKQMPLGIVFDWSKTR